MADINDLISRYFARDADIGIPGELQPDTSDGNRLSYLVDGDAYFGALRQEINDLLIGGTNRYFYFANWWLGLVKGPTFAITAGPGVFTSAWKDTPDLADLRPFRLDDGSGDGLPALISQLEQMDATGVDVRALAWVSPFILTYEKAEKVDPGLWAVNIHTLLSAVALRARGTMGDKLMLSILAHPLGAIHLKLVLCGDDSKMHAYVAGLDFVSNRIDGWQHTHDPGWHDVGVRVEGPAASAFYEYYRRLWNEQLTRDPKTFRVSGEVIKSHSERMAQLPPRTAPMLSIPLAERTQHVQVLRTAPKMNFTLGPLVSSEADTVPVGCFLRLVTGFRQDKLSFAPDGIFEFHLALHKAIRAAQRFIYIEDQYLNAWEMMGWLNEQLKAKPDLKLIMLYGADPSDAPDDSGVLPYAINNRLLADLSDASRRIAFYKRGGGITVHSKITLIDDEWVAVGTANFARRSLYTDGELSIAVLDEAEPSFAQGLRKELWGEHCQSSGELLAPGEPRNPLLDLNVALAIWDHNWGLAPAGISLRDELERSALPFVTCEQARGTVAVIQGSKDVIGSDTMWTDELIDEGFKVVSDPLGETYKITGVDAGNQRLTLDRKYKQSSASARQYRISQTGRWLDDIPNFDDREVLRKLQRTYDRSDADSRQQF